jgi:poly-gamma-glutamate synthesis protein (capsule biosynthesis protein)
MIFCGDIALPYKGSIQVNIPDDLKNKVWFGNLEGSLVEQGQSFLREHKVYNDCAAIGELCKQIHFSGFGIANNHLLDAANVSETIYNLDNLSKPYAGAGRNLKDAQRGITVTDEQNVEYLILCFGWNAINCKYATPTSEGVNPYIKENVINLVYKALNTYPDKKIICFFHWNYELEQYPQPLDRELSYCLIDKGIYAVIGCHAHRVQGVEMYKGHPIVYGIGNFLFLQGVFCKGKLCFPAFVGEEMAIELTDDKQVLIHWFRYDNLNKELSYVATEELSKSQRIKKLTPFETITLQEYPRWFLKHRFHRKKLLPIFNYKDSKGIVEAKCKYIIIRHKVVVFLKELINCFAK